LQALKDTSLAKSVVLGNISIMKRVFRIGLKRIGKDSG